MFFRIFYLLYVLLALCCLQCRAEEDIFQKRELRLDSSTADSVFSSQVNKSELSGIEKIDGSLSLVSPVEGVQSFTLQQAVSMAFSKNLKIQAKALYAKMVPMQNHLDMHTGKFYFDASTGVHKSGNFGSDPRTTYLRGVGDLSELENSWYAGLDLRYPLFDGGRTEIQQRIGILRKEIANFEMNQEKNKLIDEVVRVFVELTLIREEIDLQTLKVEQARALVMQKEQDPASGGSMPMDLVQSKLSLEEELENDFSVRNRQRHLENRFRNLLGMKPDQAFSVERNARTKMISETLEGYLKIAMEQNDRILIARKETEILLLEKKKAHASRQPSMELFGRTTWAKVMDRSSYDEVRFTLGADLDLAILDGRNTMTKTRMEKTKAEGNELFLQATVQEVETEVRYWFHRFLDIKSRIPALMNHVRLARQVLYEAEDRYQKKQISRQKLLEVRIGYRKAVLQFYQTVGKLVQTKVGLASVCSRLDEEFFG